MKFEPQYSDVIAVIMSIEDELIRSLDMSEEEALEEAYTLNEAVSEDAELLRSRGCPEIFINTLLSRIKLFGYITTYILLKIDDDASIQEMWMSEKRKGYALRRTLVGAFEVAYRNEKRRLAQIDSIKEGRGDADMIVDLLSYAEMGNAYPEALAKIFFDMAQLEEARTLSNTLSTLLAKCNIAPDEEKELRELRNRAYTWLKEAMDEIRTFGLWIHADNPEKRERYVSAFHQENGKKGAATRKKNIDEAEMAEEISTEE